MKNKLFIILTILFLSIGFAAVSTTLFLNGTIKIGTNEEDFDIYFSNAILDNEEDLTLISSDKKTINFETRDLSKIGDKSILEYEVTNASTQYDANVTMECVGGTNENDYYTITKNFPSLIVAGTKEVGKVEVELKKVTTENLTETFTCTLKGNAVERTEAMIKPCNVVSGDGTNVGDKITCGSESFYVIKNDGINIRMLAEYNLEVGYNNNSNKLVLIENPSGMQKSHVRGWVTTGSDWNGVVAFSNKNSSYEDSTIKLYVDEYKDKLILLGIPVKEATLITKQELNELGMKDNVDNVLVGREWVYQTSYWTNSIGGKWCINSAGNFNDKGVFNSIVYNGVRPVISIPVDQI